MHTLWTLAKWLDKIEYRVIDLSSGLLLREYLSGRDKLGGGLTLRPSIGTTFQAGFMAT
jgi:hypothetical protein